MTCTGSRILVVEDHHALGRLIAATLADAGWVTVGPVSDHASALDAVRREPLAMALLDRMLHGRETFAIADAAAERGIACLLISGYPSSSLPPRLRDVPFLEKPFSTADLVAAVRTALGGSA